jgi:2-amino-4-hydroxy-6-hydroxymethyldihydropteridine diphosphokinase
VKQNVVFLGLGSNLGNREENLQFAQKHINDELGRIVSESSIYETAAWGITEQNSFLNQVIEIETSFSAKKVLKLILEIEIKMGRVREIKWGERSIDIDILYYNNEIISTENLEIPHPFIQERKFVLVPLCEIANTFVHPKLKTSNLDLLKNCQDSGEVWLYQH